MWRNIEIRILFLIVSIISIAAVMWNVMTSILPLYILLATIGMLISVFFAFTWWRYRNLEKLSAYLRKISAGHYTLDIRDNREGELSILKNEIYKVTLMLSEQGNLLKKDKIHLVNAISDISHQLKTPLTSMTVMADLLSDDHLPTSKRKEFVQNLQVQLERIEWLVSSLLKLSKIDAGSVPFKKEPINVRELIEKALRPVLVPIDVKMQTVQIEKKDDVTFIGDFNWTAEALINMLKNCVEHTPIGGTIAISYSENALFTEIKIADNGIGIPSEDLPHIFKRFYKGKTADKDSVGIGLAMAHSIVTSQNGTVDVQSQPGEGTAFHIKFYKQII
ncbi:signal transduction histidine kinase [Bacillus thermophilus]|uniref:histidine kinase n=1 Tax=Siminovitchia thermophila TaxID=1245522 RepID=A0ABS2R3R6_9BACI|nr:HAMP domain-containing sensor histidine kinase [Siminovitchia thermophila]MBM7714257.1 signal transduction histidine kinase [Siminovitchia thermophila]ONK22166.1 two-component sensor histidine kinase [Bacillus sp. VT-16-64]